MDKIKTKHLFYLGFLFHIIAAYFSDGFLQYDEHFQILEYFGYKIGITPESALSFEYGLKMRPWIQPFFYYYISWPLRLMGLDNPFHLAFYFRLISMMIGFYSLKSLYQYAQSYIQDQKLLKVLAIILNLLWFIPMLHARLSSEAIGASLFIIAFCLWFKPHKKEWYHFLIIGLLFGACFQIRYHIGLSIFFIWFYALLLKKNTFKELGLISLGIVLLTLLGFFIDYWGYQSWTLAPYEYFKFNILQKGASKWGESPWWRYFPLMLERGVFPIAITLMISSIFFWVKYFNHPITWVTLPYLVIHCLIPHKELRFLFPIIMFSPLIFIFSLKHISFEIFKNKFIKSLVYLVFVINFLLLVQASFRSLKSSIRFYKFQYSQINAPEKIYVLGDQAPYRIAALPQHYFNKHYPEEILINDDNRNEYIQNLLDSENEFWLFSTRGHYYFETEKIKRCQLQYLSLPEWTLKFNFGNWIGRSEIWSLFRCN